MTVGLAYSDGKRIYLAIESMGLPVRGFDAKILCLQADPAFLVLVAGGLDHWRDVASRYRRQQTIQAAADEICRHLDDCLGPANQAYGRLCGFDEGQPVCFRIVREPNQDRTSRAKFALRPDRVEFVGCPVPAKKAGEKALASIVGGDKPLAALHAAIDARMPHEYLCIAPSSVARPLPPGKGLLRLPDPAVSCEASSREPPAPGASLSLGYPSRRIRPNRPKNERSRGLQALPGHGFAGLSGRRLLVPGTSRAWIRWSRPGASHQAGTAPR